MLLIILSILLVFLFLVMVGGIELGLILLFLTGMAIVSLFLKLSDSSYSPKEIALNCRLL